jgi:hypothetical protein
MSPLWPYPVNVKLTLDSTVSPDTLDLTDLSRPNGGGPMETVQSQVLWGKSGLANTAHTLVVSRATGGQFVVVDALV